MQFQNDDMDEIFKRAAEDYPLNTGAASWDKVKAALAEPASASKKGGGRQYRWLLLLLLVPFFCNRWSGIAPEINEGIEATTATTYMDGRSSHEKEAAAGRHIENRGTKAGDVMPPANEGIPAANAATPPLVVADRSLVIRLATPTGKKTVVIGASFRQDKAADEPMPGEGSEKQFTEGEKKEETAALPPGQSLDEPLRNRALGLDILPAPASPDSFSSSATAAATTIPQKKDAGAPAIERNKPTDSAAQAKETEAHVTTRAGEGAADNEKHFYAGLVLGPDFTTVGFKNWKEAGYEIGIVIGYAWNARWAVESGLLFEKKNYYSSGSEFNAEHLYLPSNYKLLDVDGYCRMIEIPLTLRYQFAGNAGSGWFGAAGFSSYLMQRENYDYNYQYYPGGPTGNRNLDYRQASSYWFSVAQFSVGYTAKLGRVGALRIAPYVKLPLGGLGIGSLKMTSLGLHLGITKPLF